TLMARLEGTCLLTQSGRDEWFEDLPGLRVGAARQRPTVEPAPTRLAGVLAAIRRGAGLRTALHRVGARLPPAGRGCLRRAARLARGRRRRPAHLGRLRPGRVAPGAGSPHVWPGGPGDAPADGEARW